MIKSTEWRLLAELLGSYVLSTPAPHAALKPIFGQEYVRRLPLTPVAADNVRVVMDDVKKRGLAGDDPPVMLLLQALANRAEVQVRPEGDRIRSILERERTALAARTADTHPFDVTVLAGYEVFLDRSDLRRALRLLHDDQTAHVVLQVAGVDGSGKSYTYELIEDAASSCDYQPALVILDESGTPEEVVETLAWRMALREQPPEPDADVRKWYGRASRWLITRAGESGRNWWLVIDGLNHLPHTSEVWELVQRLAEAVRYYSDGRVRLVLLGYEGPLHHSLRNRSAQDTVKLLEEDDVRQFFRAWFAKSRAHDGPDEHERLVDDTVAQVLAFAQERSESGGRYMQELGRAVEDLVRIPADNPDD